MMGPIHSTRRDRTFVPNDSRLDDAEARMRRALGLRARWRGASGGRSLVVDLEWNRKTIFEKLDWLKDNLEDVINKANQNVSIYQEQLRAITARVAALEKPERKLIPAPTVKTKEPKRATLRPARRSAPSKGKP
jgi:hypothetical protein